MRIPESVIKFYKGEKHIKGRKTYGYAYKFYPHIRIRKYCENGMAYLPLLFNLLDDCKKEATIPICSVVNRDAKRINSLLNCMVRSGELVKKREPLTAEEREYYENLHLLNRYLRKNRGRLIKVNKIIGGREYRIRSLTEEEVFDNATSSFYLIGILYTSPITSWHASALSGYSLSTVWGVNTVYTLYNLIGRIKNRYAFRSKAVAARFMMEFEKKRMKIIEKAEKYVKAVELANEYGVGGISKALNIPRSTVFGWVCGYSKPMGFPIPEPSAKRLQLPEEIFERYKNYGLISKTVEEIDEWEIPTEE